MTLSSEEKEVVAEMATGCLTPTVYMLLDWAIVYFGLNFLQATGLLPTPPITGWQAFAIMFLFHQLGPQIVRIDK